MVVSLYSNTGRYKGDIEIYPLSICGSRSLTHLGSVVESDGCHLDDDHDVAGGRYEKVFEIPKGFKKMVLTSGETSSVCDALGEEAKKYILSDTVHGAWKIKCHQGAVLVKD